MAFGHINMVPPLMLLYQLACAGFDCREAAVKLYNHNIAVIVRKRHNGVHRGLSFGLLPPGPAMTPESRAIAGDEVSDALATSFPFPVSYPRMVTWPGDLNWGDPI